MKHSKWVIRFWIGTDWNGVRTGSDRKWLIVQKTRHKKTTGVHPRTLASYRCLSIAEGFDVLLLYDSLLRFPLKSKSSGSTSTVGIASGMPPVIASVRATHTLSSQCHWAAHSSHCLLKTDVLW